jgi:hypothetical protein
MLIKRSRTQFNGIKSFCNLLSCLMKFNLHTCLLPFLLLFPPLAWSNMEFTGDASIDTNDNVSSAVSGRIILNDQFLSANYNLDKLWVPPLLDLSCSETIWGCRTSATVTA